MRIESKKLKYAILSIGPGATTVSQFTARVLHPTGSCDLIFDTTLATRSKNAQITVYATETNQVTIKLTNGAGTSIVAVAKGFTVINTDHNGTPVVGITGTGSGANSGSGFISEIIETSANILITTAGADVIVDTPNVVITPDSSIEEEPNFLYISNNSTGDITFDGHVIPKGTRVGWIYSDDNSAWIVFMDRGENAPGFIQGVVELSVSTELTEAGMNIVVDTGEVVLTTHSSIEVEPNFMYINNISDNAITFAGHTVIAGTRTAFVYSDDASAWIVFMSDSASTTCLSHCIGFGKQPHPTIPFTDEFFMDIIPLLSNVTIDTTKYNLFFEDGSPAWRVVNTGVDVENVLTAGATLTKV